MDVRGKAVEGCVQEFVDAEAQHGRNFRINVGHAQAAQVEDIDNVGASIQNALDEMLALDQGFLFLLARGNVAGDIHVTNGCVRVVFIIEGSDVRADPDFNGAGQQEA